MRKISAKAMKTLMLADVFFPDTIGGAGRVAYHLSCELSKKGHEVHILTRNAAGELPHDEKLNDNVHVHRFPTPQRESFGLFFSELKNSYRLAKKLSQEIQFDIYCAHQSLVAMGPCLSGCMKGIPMIYYFHSPWPEEYFVKKRGADHDAARGMKIASSVMKFIEKRIMLRASRTIVLSQYMRDKILTLHHYPEHRIIKIPGGIDLNRFHLPEGGKAAVKKARTLPSDRTIFLTVRNLVPRMGLETLIESFSQSRVLREKGLLLIGGRGFLEDRLKTQVESSKLQGCVRFLGYIPDEDLAQLYQAADFFVLPTRKLEGFGLVILEAMACGTPVLGTPVGAIPEISGKFDNRLIFDGIQWREMKHKLEQTIEKPERFTFEPEACRKFVEANFSWKKMADAFEQAMMKLVGNRE